MDILRNIYYDGRYCGCFKLKNVDGRFMWCPIYGTTIHAGTIYKNHLDHPYCDYSAPNFTFDEGDLDLPE